MLVTLPMVSFLHRETAHFPFDHTGTTTVSSLTVDFAGHLNEQQQIVIFMTSEGGKNPLSISWTG